MARAKKIPLITDFKHIPAEALVPEEDQPYPLPAHWKWVRLESVVEMRIGKTPARAKEKYWNLHDYPWVKISDFTDTGVIAGSQEQISSVAFREVFKGRLVPAGTLLMSFKLTIGKCAILDIAAVHNEAIISIFPQCNIVNRDYLFYCLPTITQFGIQRSAVKGNTLNSKSLNALPLPLPPLTEQKTIVAYLDEKLGKINSVREKLQDFLDHAAQRKDNLIQAGVTGHLTEKWREKNQDCSRTMFTNEELQQVSVPETWKWRPLGDVATILNGDRGKNYAGRSTWIDSGIPFVNAGTLQNSVLTEEGMNYISKDTYSKLNGGKLRPGDILFCLRGSLGKCALNTSYQEGAIGSSIAITRSGDSTNPRFSFYYFLSPISKIMIDKFDNGSAQPNLSAKSLKQFKVPLPSLDEQEEIARILDKQLERAEKTDKLVAEVLERLDTMKQQIVSAALAGRLSLQVS